jgi:predicted O-methyltransferase YrrM
LHFLYELGKQSKYHLEIGAYCGKSLFVTACAMSPGSKIVVIDPLEFNYLIKTDPYFNIPYDQWVEDTLKLTLKAIKIHNPEVEVELVQRKSIDVAREYVRRGEPPFDTIYIDGDHTYEGVLQDIESWYPMLREGGVICGHDYWPKDPGVMDAVDHVFHDQFEADFQVHQRIWAHSKPISEAAS